MSHEIDSMFSVREMPWHAAQTMNMKRNDGETARTIILDKSPENWDEVRKVGGFAWEPRKSAMYGPARILQRGDQLPEGFEIVAELPDGGRVVQEVIDGWSMVERDDDNRRLGVVRASMPLISHAQMGDLVEAFTAEWRKAGASVVYETAGVLGEGQTVWALVRLDEPFTIPGDDSATYPYFAIKNNHDGTGACKGMPTNIRIVCANTCSMADLAADQTGHQVIIRHVGDEASIEQRIEEAKATLAAIRANSMEWRAIATDLAGQSISDTVLRDFVADFIPMPDGATDRMRTSRMNARAKFMELYESPFTGMPGNAYGLFSTAVEYLDHMRRTNSGDTYLSRTILKAEPAKARALAKIRELVPALGA